MNERWLKAWEEGRTAFHLSAVNPQLVRFADRWLGDGPRRILVPLCGKTLDLAWLADRGHAVAGVELSEIAARGVFEASGRTPAIEPGRPTVYRSPGLCVLQGDFFDVDAGALATVLGGSPTHAWDRASMIALPPDVRLRYVDHLRRLLGPGGRVLLDTLSYDPAVMDGPPFSVAEGEVRVRYAGATVELLETAELEIEERWKVAGHRWMRRHVFLITL